MSGDCQLKFSLDKIKFFFLGGVLNEVIMPSFGIKELLHGKMPTPFIHMKLTRALLCLGRMSSFYFVFFFK